MKLELPGIRVSHFRMAAGERVRDHRHPNFHILCLLDGSMEQEEERNSVSLCPGGVRLSRSEAAHSIDFGASGGECLVVHLTDPRLVPRSAKASSRFLDQRNFAPLFRRLASAEASEPTRLWLDVREAVAGATLGADRPDAEAPPAWLREVREGLLQPDLRPSPIRGRSVSDEHFARTFRRYFGASPTETRQAARLGRALALLRTPEARLSEVALEAGYSDQSHFTNLTRRMLGTTPAAYRAGLRTVG